MNIISSTTNFIRPVLIASLVIASSIAAAQQSERQISATKDFAIGEQRQKGGDRFAAVIMTPQGIQAAGLQFRIAYDPAVVQVASTENCLLNLSSELSGALHSCKDIPERNLVQVVITDLSGKHQIPGGFELGFVEFEARSSGLGDVSNSVSVTDIHVSDNISSKGVSKEVGLDVIEF